MTTLSVGTTHWDPSSVKMESPRSRNNSGLSLSALPTSPSQCMFVSDIGQEHLDAKPSLHSADAGPSARFQTQQPIAFSMLPSNSVHPPHTSFTAMNSSDARIQDMGDAFTILPLQTRFHGDITTYDANANFSADGSVHSATYPTSVQWENSMELENPAHQHRRESVRDDADSGAHTTGRRRKSESVVPGSARAVYLEKNRKAASKCRTKQKKQQEDLVGTARDMERRNKILKSEVEFLKSDLRDLMELVGKHHECPDSRLRKYVQQEADRLAGSDTQSPVAELLSSNGSANGNASP